MLVSSGFIYDIFGRRWTIFCSFFLSGLCILSMPLGAPRQWVYIVGNCLFNFVLSPIRASPLVLDYVTKQSRGTAISFGTMGFSIGVILSLSVVFEFTKDLDPRYSWGTMSASLVIFSFALLAMIDEPRILKQKRQRKEGLGKEMKNLSSQLYQAVKSNPNLLFGWLFMIPAAGPSIILEIYLMSWLQGYYSEDGTMPFKDQDQVYHYYQLQGTIGYAVAFCALGLVGKAVDMIPLKFTFPFFFCFRALMYYLTYKITDPVSQRSLYFFAVPLLHGSFQAVIIVITSFLQK